MMVLFARQEQANRQRGLKDTTRALALAIDQEIESSVTNLTALATSEPLDFGSCRNFASLQDDFCAPKIVGKASCYSIRAENGS
jgi:hypothetical protein